MHALRDRVVVVTGAARGIGLALARRFAAEGSILALADLDGEALAEAVRSLRGGGTTVRGYALDVTDFDSVSTFREQVLADAGAVDVLVNNAGVVFGGAFRQVPLEKHRTTFDVNVMGVVHCTYAFFDDLAARPEAHVVNMSSASGLIPLPWAATYAASKWAVLGFSDSLRRELESTGRRHVRVTAVCPSYVATGLFAGAKAPFLSRILTPERVADATVRAVLRNRAAVLLPWLVRVTPILKGILPRRGFEAVSDLLGATGSMREWRGR
jgi:short-subunit dehydrogenase